jgi:hypothetical protein
LTIELNICFESKLKRFCFPGQVCGWSNMHQVGFRLSVWVNYAVSSVPLSTAL